MKGLLLLHLVKKVAELASVGRLRLPGLTEGEGREKPWCCCFLPCSVFGLWNRLSPPGRKGEKRILHHGASPIQLGGRGLQRAPQSRVSFLKIIFQKIRVQYIRSLNPLPYPQSYFLSVTFFVSFLWGSDLVCGVSGSRGREEEGQKEEQEKGE